MADAEPPEIPAGEGTPEPLPQGEATQLNEALAQGQADAQAPLTPLAPRLPQVAAPSDYQPQYQPQSADEQFITGPTMRPNEDVTSGAAVSAGISPELRRALPALVDAASSPGADPNMLFLADFLIRAAEQ